MLEMTTDLATFVKRTRFPGILEARKCLGDQAVILAIANFLEIKTAFGGLGHSLGLDAWQTYDLIERLREYGLEQRGGS